MPYIFRNCALMSSMSTSALATIILMSTLSVVPSPLRETEGSGMDTLIDKALCGDSVFHHCGSIRSTRYLPSLICTTAPQRMQACSLCTSLQRNKKLLQHEYIRVRGGSSVSVCLHSTLLSITFELWFLAFPFVPI